MSRLAPLCLVLITVPAGAEDAAVDLLAAIFDAPEEPARKRLSALFAKKGLPAAGLLDRIAPRVKTDEGRAAVERLFAAWRTEVRKKPPHPRVVNRLSDGARWRLGVGEKTLFFDATTFNDKTRLHGLEYLVCPVPPAAKAYECLAGMAPAEFEAFRKRYKAGCTIVLRWRDEKGRLKQTPMVKMLPWSATKRPISKWGLMIGGNHDERKNAKLPPDGTPIQVGIVLTK
jgi:hypothetical protein